MSDAKNRQKQKYIVGVDEVGRGPIAGPVAVCAVALTAEQIVQFAGVRDSKQISENVREAWYAKAKEAQIRCAVSFVSGAKIDRYGIVPSIRSALDASLAKLALDPSECEVLLDGGLRAPAQYIHQTTIIRGDATETAISLASIIAKVTRDAHMVSESNKYPLYGFETHKGYGTRAHYTALRAYGMSDIHRRSFLRKYFEVVQKEQHATL